MIAATNEPATAPTLSHLHTFTRCCILQLPYCCWGSVNVGAISTKHPMVSLLFILQVMLREGESDFDNACGIIFNWTQIKRPQRCIHLSRCGCMGLRSFYIRWNKSLKASTRIIFLLLIRSTNMFTTVAPLSSDKKTSALSDEQLADWDTDWAPYSWRSCRRRRTRWVLPHQLGSSVCSTERNNCNSRRRRKLIKRWIPSSCKRKRWSRWEPHVYTRRILRQHSIGGLNPDYFAVIFAYRTLWGRWFGPFGV